VLITIAVGLFFALPYSSRQLRAHQAWILPNFFRTEQNPAWLSFDTTWGDSAFTPMEGPGLQQIWIVGPSDQRRTPPLLYVGKTKTVGECELDQSGTYRIEAFKPPTYWTRVVDGDAEKWLRKSKDLVGDAKIVRSDQYWSKAVAYVTVEKVTTEPLASQNDLLELAPINHPNEIFAGTVFQARLFGSGTPMPDHPIKVFAEGSQAHEATVTHNTDKEGLLSVKFDQPGRYLLVAQHERKTPKSELADVQSLNFYLMLYVAEKLP